MLVSLRLSDEPIKIGDSVERHAHSQVAEWKTQIEINWEEHREEVMAQNPL